MQEIHGERRPARPARRVRREDGREPRARARSAPARRALLLERDPLVRERITALLSAEGVAVCALDDPALFEHLRAHASFRWFVVGVRGARELRELRDALSAAPLIALVPPGRAGRAALRVALPDALLVERDLRDPDLLRNALAPPRAVPERDPDPVRRAFEPFGVTERQLEVIRHALLGRSSGEIAAELFISEPTVRNHLHAIYARLGVKGRRELVGRFVRGLLEAAA